MDKKQYHEYLNRWKLVAEAEEQEIKDAPFELLLQQTFSIWDIGRMMGFSGYNKPRDSSWAYLQKKWLLMRHKQSGINIDKGTR